MPPSFLTTRPRLSAPARAQIERLQTLVPTRTALMLKCQLVGILVVVAACSLVWVLNVPSVSAAWPVALLLGSYNALLHLLDIVLPAPVNASTLRTQTEASKAWPLVSILIPAHNEEQVIWNTVQRLQEQNYPNFEIWIIDDRSEDGTRAVIEALRSDYKLSQKQPELARLNILSRPQDAYPGKSAALNDALAIARGEIIAVLDADGHIPETFLRDVVPCFSLPKVGALQVPKRIDNANVNILTRWQGLEYELDAALQNARFKFGSAVELRGNGMLVTREALQAVGGWTLETVTDDLDLSTKLHMAGYRIAFAAWSHVNEEGLTQWQPLFKQRTRWAQGSMQRFLQYGARLLLASKANAITRLDALVYSLTFILPLALMLDVGLMWVSKSHWLSWFGVWGLLSASVGLSFFWHLLTHHRQSIPKAGLHAVLSTACMLTIWFPVVVQGSCKILLQRSTRPVWAKTQHGHAH